MSAPELSRRSAAALLGLGVAASRLKAAQAALNALRRDPAEAKLQFFTPAQHELLDALTEMILPADEHSPGAHAAAVGKYIDLVVANSTPETQAAWRANLAAFEAFAGQAGKPFLRAAPAQRAKVLEQLAARADRPGTRTAQRTRAQREPGAGRVPRLPLRAVTAAPPAYAEYLRTPRLSSAARPGRAVSTSWSSYSMET